ncbi:MAG TPA: NAD(P)/FAD-dependent oxidoreductase, partial [Chthoniobacterales bacterium]
MIQHKDLDDPRVREVIVIGGGIAGLSAAIYLGRAQRDTLVIDSGHSMAKWEPVVGNYLGFPDGVSGEDLLTFGKQQAEAHDVRFTSDEIREITPRDGELVLRGKSREYRAKRLLLATGIFHLPPEIPGVKECLGHSMFFCKDCDGFRVREKRIAICGANDEAVEYALGMLLYSACVVIATNGEIPHWSPQHSKWIEEYEIPVHEERIVDVEHRDRKILALHLDNDQRVEIDNIFTTRGDIYHTELAQSLGAKLDEEGQIMVDDSMRTSVRDVYAAGCVTPANCQMIIAAGQGATAA